MPKKKVVVLGFDDEAGAKGVVIISADNQVKLVPEVGDVAALVEMARQSYEVSESDTDSVMQTWEEVSYTALQDLSVFFDSTTGGIVRPLKVFPSGRVVLYVAFAPGGLCFSAKTEIDAKSRLDALAAVHVGTPSLLPEIVLPDPEQWRKNRLGASGEPLAQIPQPLPKVPKPSSS